MKFSQVFQAAFMAATVAAAPAATSGLAKRSADLDEAIVIKILTAYGDVKPSAGGEYPHLHPSSNKITLGTGQRYDSKEVEELIRLVLDEAHSQYAKA